MLFQIFDHNIPLQLMLIIKFYRHHKNSGTGIKESDLQWLRVTRTGFIEHFVGNLVIYCHFSNIHCSRATQKILTFEMFVYVQYYTVSVKLRDWARIWSTGNQSISFLVYFLFSIEFFSRQIRAVALLDNPHWYKCTPWVA